MVRHATLPMLPNPAPIVAVAPPVGPMPPGLYRGGLMSPSGVLPPPPAGIEYQELAYVEAANANRDPRAVAWTEALSEGGGTKLWFELAKQYRHEAGFLRGWIGTGLMATAMGVTALRTWDAKRNYHRLRPYQVDPNIHPIGKLPKDASYPSGHTSSSFAAATVLENLWPQRAAEYEWWARQVAMSRVHAGVHFPSDVETGARLGRRIGFQVVSGLF